MRLANSFRGDFSTGNTEAKYSSQCEPMTQKSKARRSKTKPRKQSKSNNLPNVNLPPVRQLSDLIRIVSALKAFSGWIHEHWEDILSAFREWLRF
jgi:hypothetical protein